MAPPAASQTAICQSPAKQASHKKQGCQALHLLLLNPIALKAGSSKALQIYVVL
jgi:hypothetical protein